MAASPVSIVPSSRYSLKRPPLILTERRLAANRRNAAHSTGPRTARGKARVAGNAVKHGFFAGPSRWTPRQFREFIETLDDFRGDLRPQTALEESCVRTIAGSFVAKAAMLRYENIAALKYHQQCERELEERIAAATPSEATHLRERREKLRRAGLWGPTIPGPRDAAAIIRYEGRLNRSIRGAMADLDGLRAMRRAATHAKSQKQTHFLQQNRGIFENDGAHRSRINDEIAPTSRANAQPSPPPRSPADPGGSGANKNEKTNPLNSAFTGNRHERRRAKALARRRT